MRNLTRRNFVHMLGTVGAASSLLGWPAVTMAGKVSGRVVIVGGGFGGASCAKYLNRLAPGLEITLIERDKQFITCPFSNAVLGGLYDIDYITHGYGALKNSQGIKVVHDSATGIDPAAKTVSLAGGSTLVDIQWGAVEGYDQAASEVMPHAWKAGPQTLLLRKQLQAMPDGGVVIVAAPRNPFRCPPGPYERVSLMAHYLKQHKPKSKILIYDAKDKFSKQPLFQQGWQALYPGMIEWIGESEGGAIEGVDTANMTVHPTFGDPVKADVINLIPPQKAGAIAHTAGLTGDGAWCPVDQRTFESTVHKGIHVIGDAAIANPMPKSGFAASSQGKVCAAAVAASLGGQEMPEPSYVNTCYSLLAPDYGISVAMVYRIGENGIEAVQGAGGVSPKDAPDSFRRDEARYTVGWYQSITSDVWG